MMCGKKPQITIDTGYNNITITNGNIFFAYSIVYSLYIHFINNLRI